MLYRRELREHTFKLLFEREFFSESELAAQVDNYFENIDEDYIDSKNKKANNSINNLEEDDRQYLKNRVMEINSAIGVLDEYIGNATSGWKLNRVGKVELAIIRLALFEMLYDETVPVKVAINEAVELAKKFGGQESPQFINGVLAKLAKEFEKSGD